MIQTSLSFDELHDGVENVLFFFFGIQKSQQSMDLEP